MRAQGGSPNLINGVSRQPPEVRLTSQLEESENLFPTVSNGLRPRNPVEFLAKLPGLGGLAHFINRDDSEKYVASFAPGDVRVWDLAGNPKTVVAPSGLTYLAGATKDTIKAVTVADHTFVLNTSKTAAMTANRSPERLPEALVHVAYAAYQKEYQIVINGIQVAKVATPGGPYETTAESRAAERATATDKIASGLMNGTGVAPDPNSAGLQTHSSLITSLDPAEWGFTLYGYVIHIQNKLGNDFSISVASGASDTSGHEAIRAHKGTVADFSMLPDKAPEDFYIRVAGSEETNYDDYHVYYAQDAGDGLGRWKETRAQDILIELDPASMPHLLRREADGTFTFTPAEWAPREVGDDDTNPLPSFVGERLTGLVFHKNRLGFTWGESVVLSRHGEFHNFWIESAQTQLDTDPIDIAISYEDISTIFSTAPLGGELALFTSSVPFRLGGGDILTPKSVNIQPLVANHTRSKAAPVGLGSGCVFASDMPAGSSVHELIYSSDSGQAKADSISEHVNGYLPGSVTSLWGDDILRTILLHSTSQPASIYAYKWLQVGNERLQSAWGRWTLPGDILQAAIIDDRLYVVGMYGGVPELWRIRLHEAWTDEGGATVYLDRRATVTGGVYSPSTDTTSFTLPYDAPTGLMMVVVSSPAPGAIYGEVLNLVTVSNTTAVVRGDHSAATLLVGSDFDAYGVLSRITPRQEREDGAGTAIPGTRTTVASVTFETTRSVAMRVDVDRAYRNAYSVTLRPLQTGTKTDILPAPLRGKLNGRVSVMANADDLTVTFRKSGPFGFSLLSYEWTGDVSKTGY